MVLFLKVGGDDTGTAFTLPSRSLSNSTVPFPERKSEEDRCSEVWGPTFDFSNKGARGENTHLSRDKASLEILNLVCLGHPLPSLLSTHLQHPLHLLRFFLWIFGDYPHPSTWIENLNLEVKGCAWGTQPLRGSSGNQSPRLTHVSTHSAPDEGPL